MIPKLDKYYVSEIDKKLAAFDQSHAPSPAQAAEIEKYKIINEKRDRATDIVSSSTSDKIWSDF